MKKCCNVWHRDWRPPSGRLPGDHLDRGIDALAFPVGGITEALHRVRAGPTVGPEAEADGALALEGALGVGAHPALARAAAALVDVHARPGVGGELVAGVADAPVAKKWETMSTRTRVRRTSGP